MTNREKFEETFHIPLNEEMLCSVSSELCQLVTPEPENCYKCQFHNWWDEEFDENFKFSASIQTLKLFIANSGSGGGAFGN